MCSEKMSVIEQMKSGKIYFCTSEELVREQQLCMEKLYDYNHSRPGEVEKRRQLLKEILAEVGEDCYIEPPLHANWGRYTHLGRNVYVNFNLTLVDDTDVYIGDDVMIGPNVVISTAGHPIDPELRKKSAQFNIPVVIGNNVWIGAGAVILPGITIGENSVIGAGSIVSRDIPPNVVAVGNPCRVLRPIGERDRLYYYRDRKMEFAGDVQ